MLFKATHEDISDAIFASSDPLTVNSNPLYIREDKASTLVNNAPMMNDSNPALKPASNTTVKKTYHAAKMYRQSVAKLAMAPRPIQIPGGAPSPTMQNTKAMSTEPSSHIMKVPHSLNNNNASRPVTGLSAAHPAALSPVCPPDPRAPELSPPEVALHSAPQGSEDEVLCMAAQVPRSAPLLPTQPLKPLNAVQERLNEDTKEELKDSRPNKRRKLSLEPTRNDSAPQKTGVKKFTATNVPLEGSEYRSDKAGPPDDVELESTNKQSAELRSRPTAAFQKLVTEHSAVFQSRKAYWSTCSMEAWLAGGEEIAERLSQLLARIICLFETDLSAFESIDQTFDDYKKGVIDKRERVLWQARETIAASGRLLGGSQSTEQR